MSSYYACAVYIGTSLHFTCHILAYHHLNNWDYHASAKWNSNPTKSIWFQQKILSEKSRNPIFLLVITTILVSYRISINQLQSRSLNLPHLFKTSICNIPSQNVTLHVLMMVKKSILWNEDNLQWYVLFRFILKVMTNSGKIITPCSFYMQPKLSGKKLGTPSKFSHSPTNNVDNQVTFFPFWWIKRGIFQNWLGEMGEMWSSSNAPTTFVQDCS